MYRDENGVLRLIKKSKISSSSSQETLPVPEKITEEKNAGSILNQSQIASPLRGKVLPLEQMKDDAFASGVLGKGAAVLPEEGKLYAPADGEIITLFPTLVSTPFPLQLGAAWSIIRMQCKDK